MKIKLALTETKSYQLVITILIIVTKIIHETKSSKQKAKPEKEGRHWG